MRWFDDLLFRIRTLFGLRRMERELDEEFRFHVEMEVQKYEREGLDREAARQRALAAFGGVTRQKQSIRDGWGVGMVRDLMADVRLAFRQIRLSPGVSATVILTLALGIGATTAIASIVRQVLLRRPPVVEPERLVALYTSCRRGDLRCPSSYPDYQDYQRRAGSIDDIAAYNSVPINVGTATSAHLAVAQLVTGNYFGLLGLVPHVGRLIQPGDNLRGSSTSVAVLSYEFWRSVLAADSAIVGRDLALNGRSFRVVGVAASGFRGLQLDLDPDLFVPMFAGPLLGPSAGSAGQSDEIFDQRGNRWIGGLVGRLAPDVNLAQARAETTTLATMLGEEYPAERAAVAGPRQITVDPAEHYILPVGREAALQQFLRLLVGMVAFALLLACANVANLLLARATSRNREIGVQLAVGAGKARLVRKLLTESLVLAVLGSGAGLVVAKSMVTALGRYELPGGVSIQSIDVSIDGTVLGFALVLAIGAALLFGIAPAWHTSRQDLTTFIKGGQAHRDARGVARLRRALVTAQVALCLILLVGSAVFAKTLRNSLRADLGFSPTGTVVLRFNPGLLRYGPARTATLRRELVERVGALPGITAASVTTLAPFQEGGFRGFLATIDGYHPAPNEEIRFDAVLVEPAFFEAMSIPIIEGRAIDGTDVAGGHLAVVVNRRAAELYWRSRSPVGGTISVGGFEATVIGVSATPTWRAVGEDPTPFVFLPIAQFPTMAAGGFLTLVVGTDGRAGDHLPAVRAAFEEVVPGLSPSFVRTMDALVGQALMPQRLGATLLTAFGALALVLAGIGIYGVVAYGVTRQARDIGIRIAIGSSTVGILRTVLLGMTGPVLAGVIIGVVSTIGLGRTVSGFLYGVDPADAGAIGGVTSVLLLVAFVATLIPAVRAARTDPVQVLSSD